MINPNIGMAGRSLSDYSFAGFPTREGCDPGKPTEAFLWMLVALPGVNGAALAAPVSYNMMISEHLWECGARPVAEPVKKWIAPSATGPHWMTSPGRWVPLSHPDPEPAHPADEAINKLTQQQRAELFERLGRMHREGTL